MSDALLELDLIDAAHAAQGAGLARLRAILTAETAARPSPPPAQPEPGGGASRGLLNPAAFFGAIRTSKALGPVLSTGEVSGCEAIAAACAGLPAAWAAYALATAVVETAGTMQPIKEYGGNAYFRRMYDIEGERPAKARELGNLNPGDGQKFAGRGFVQITGRSNYQKAARELGVDFVSDPDLALEPKHAAAIMRRGMQEGWFTGKRFETYLPAEASRDQFKNSRRIINALDRADEIAGYALEFQAALKAGGWS